MPAILLTMGLELFNAFVITNFVNTLMKTPLLISFMPVIAAISGNVGLQSAAIHVRALAVGIIPVG
jgi:magnesium transporter